MRLYLCIMINIHVCCVQNLVEFRTKSQNFLRGALPRTPLGLTPQTPPLTMTPVGRYTSWITRVSLLK